MGKRTDGQAADEGPTEEDRSADQPSEDDKSADQPSEDGKSGGGYWETLGQQKARALSLRREEERRHGGLGRAIMHLGERMASAWFFAALLVAHLLWIVLNLGVIPGIPPWDPPPFPILAMIASVEAPFLALLILMHQQREQNIAELREEMSLQVALHAERESTKLLRMMRELHEHLEVRSQEHDNALDKMAEPLDPSRLRHLMEVELEETRGDPDEEEHSSKEDE